MEHFPSGALPSAVVCSATALSLSVAGATAPAHAEAAANQSSQGVDQRIHNLEQQLSDLKKQVNEADQKATAAQNTSSASLPDINWHLGDYATADLTTSDASGANDFFGGGKFNPIFLVSYKDLLVAESEVEISTTTEGETKTQLEFGNLNLNVTDWLTLTAGKFLSPLGDFQQHLHPSWINKLPDRPAGFAEDGGDEHISEVGVMARGAVPVNSMVLEYSAFVGNGPRLAPELDEGVKMEGFGNDDNGNKAVGGRIGLRPVPYVSVGVSAMKSTISGHAGTGEGATRGDYNLEDVDFAYTRGNWDVRGEYIRAHLDGLMSAVDPMSSPQAIPATTWHNWYAQAAYRLADVSSNDSISKLEPVVRYSQFHVNGFDKFTAKAEDRWSVGLDYWISSSIVAKVAYENRDFRQRDTANVGRAQLAFGF